MNIMRASLEKLTYHVGSVANSIVARSSTTSVTWQSDNVTARGTSNRASRPERWLPPPTAPSVGVPRWIGMTSFVLVTACKTPNSPSLFGAHAGPLHLSAPVDSYSVEEACLLGSLYGVPEFHLRTHGAGDLF